MAHEQPTKALVVAFTDDAAAAVSVINRLQPEALCFVLPESAKALVESAVQPHIEHMPRRWDWVTLADTVDVAACHHALAGVLPDLLKAWDVHSGDLVLDLTGATPAMAGALTLVTLPTSSRTVALLPWIEGQESEPIMVGSRPMRWAQGNLWDDVALVSRHEAAELFNRGMYSASARLFREIETRVSGGQKPTYRAFADLAEGYEFWERFHYRQAWDKLKTATKALEMASLWGGPPGLKAVLPGIKANAGFLERLVLDPAAVKDSLCLDLLAHVSRRLHVGHDPESAMIVLMRALESFAQRELFKQYKIKTWDVQPEQLPQALQEACRMSWLDDVDGKYKAPLQGQFRVLAALGDPLGQAFLREWPTMKPLLDAANHGVLGHGFEPVKSERVQQLYDVVAKLAGVTESSLPKFPTLAL
ncbi:MAG: TIGR02710 family CRISPR-associated protein [Nitrospiraceae bacterium]|nr:TIGR02710 family CRISPR-associated protein [Nitrospiraceae bacterium]OQW63886.1 MAG: CRISPR-associated protein [Nitrospira sp. ST-bin5]